MAEDGRPICRTQHTAIQGIHLLRLGDNLSGLGAGLRSEQHPLERPELTGTQRARVEHDNEAARFFCIGEINQLADRGRGSVRENHYNSLHWWKTYEVSMWESGRWLDQRYSACCFGGARAKMQRLQHNIAGLPGADLSKLRKCAMGLLSELKRRWENITSYLRTKQTEAIRTATSQRDIGLTAVLLLLANWGDVTLPAGLCLGLPAVGYA